ncbi:hypothetical protein FHG87_021268, partial [Trinorchestia longiramus]
MVSLLNSEESSLLCVGASTDGRVEGAVATAATLARFVRGVLIINHKFILPSVRRGCQNKRCCVRCVPVADKDTKRLVENSWVVEIHLSGDQ